MIKNCMDCSFKLIVHDPDPTDWFCDDDLAVLCSKKTNSSNRCYYDSNRLFEYEPITVSCRPHHLKKECETPSWCPLNKQGE